MQAWLSVEGLDIATIGFLSLVGLPYTFKFLWAPLMDRFELPWLGRRRGWLVLTQLALAGALLLAGRHLAERRDPRLRAAGGGGGLHLGVAGRGHRRLPHRPAAGRRARPGRVAERAGLPAGDDPVGRHRADLDRPDQGGGWTWPEVYRFMAGADGRRGGALGARCCRGCRCPTSRPTAGAQRPARVSWPCWPRWRWACAQRPLRPAARALRCWRRCWKAARCAPTLQQRWADLLALLLGIAFTLPLAAWAARRARFETLLGGLRSYFSQRGAAAFLAFIVLYKLGDAFAGSLMTPFLLKSMAYSPAEVGVVNKVIGLWLTIGGALLGGALMFKLGLWRALLLFGVLQMASNLGFWWLAVSGKGLMPGLVLPAFDWGFVQLAHADAGGRRAADGDRLREPVRRHGHGGLRRLPDEPVQPALHRHAVRAAVSAFASVGPRLGRAAGRRAGRIDRLAGVLHRQHRGWRCRRC